MEALRTPVMAYSENNQNVGKFSPQNYICHGKLRKFDHCNRHMNFDPNHLRHKKVYYPDENSLKGW